MTDSKTHMRDLVDTLNRAGRAYYTEDREVMSNLEYDRLYQELQDLEKTSGIVLSDSPTLHVGYEISSRLPKETHEKPMLSLDKTKDVSVLASFAGSHRSLLSWKMDGLTVVLTYKKGELYKAVTRGNGITGEVVTPNAKAFKNIPLKIPYEGDLVLRGEAIIRYSDFEKINNEISDVDAQYKNPRNLSSGSVRQLNSENTAKRCVYFFAFALVQAAGVDFHNSHENEYKFLSDEGFTVVGYKVVTEDTVPETVSWFSKEIIHNDFPSDGLVELYDDIAYGKSLGTTAKFPKNALAFKWKDEIQNTVLRKIEWSPSRTGLINPIAIFDPVELEGTTVKRASVHNISTMKSLKLGIGDTISVYKANMIIPQIAEDLTKSGNLQIPDRCPVCGGEAKIQSERDESGNESGVLTLHCMNPECQAKKIRSFDLFVSRDALNIDGLSEATLEKFIARGFIRSFADIFRLSEHQKEIEEMDGFGSLSYTNLMKSVESARTTTPSRLIFGLGIPNVGEVNAKILSRAYKGDINALRKAKEEDLSAIPAIGPVIASSVASWFADQKNGAALDQLLGLLSFHKDNFAEEGSLSGKNLVITGALTHFANRHELKDTVESLGGKLTGSVTKNTDYLISNEPAGTSTKARTAAKLNIPVITENEFMEMIKDADQTAK